MNKNLKPCPFCGTYPNLEYDEHIKKFWINCNNPKCKIWPCTDVHKNKGVIVREWNKRMY